DFRQVTATTSEDVEIAAMGIALQTLLNLKRQTLHAAPQVGVPRRNPDPDAARNRNHRRDSAFKTRDNAAVSTSVQTRIRSPSARTISIWPAASGQSPSASNPRVIVTGTIFTGSLCSGGSTPILRRQVNKRLALSS